MPRWTLELDLIDLPPESRDDHAPGSHPAPGSASPEPLDVVALMGQARGRATLEGEIPEYGQVWLWDRYCAAALYAMGEGAIEVQALKEAMELWSVNLSAKLFQPRDHLRRKGHLTICQGLIWDDARSSEADEPRGEDSAGGRASASADQREAASGGRETPGAVSLAEKGSRRRMRVVLEVEGKAGELPACVEVEPPRSARERFWTVVALAQYFIDHNDLFARELPIHVLALRKFHADIAEPHTTTARDDAPFFAIQKALEYFQKANRGTVQ